MNLEEEKQLEKEIEKELELITLLARYTDIPQSQAVDIVLWTQWENITQEVIDFVEEKLNRGEIVKEIEIMDYIYDLVTAKEEHQN